MWKELFSKILKRINKMKSKLLFNSKQTKGKDPNRIDFSKLKNLTLLEIDMLSNLSFMDTKKNLMLDGNCYYLKNKIAQELKEIAIGKGQRAHIIKCSDLLNSLKKANDVTKVISQYKNYDLLIIDQFLYYPLMRSDIDLLLQIVYPRKINGSTVFIVDQGLFNHDIFPWDPSIDLMNFIDDDTTVTIKIIEK